MIGDHGTDAEGFAHTQVPVFKVRTNFYKILRHRPIFNVHLSRNANVMGRKDNVKYSTPSSADCG